MFSSMPIRVALRSLALAALLAVPLLNAAPAAAADPIRVGGSLALTGAGAGPGKMLQRALEIWRDDVNAHGGLLGRPVELVYYDDQSTPSNVPNIYTKLITVDKVDLLLGPYATNFVAPAMPVIIEHNKMTISFTAIGINRQYNYNRYFSMVAVGPDGVNAFSKGFFELAAAQNPKPQTVAILAGDAEFARSASDGAREEAKKRGFKVVYDQSYPPNATDFAPMVRAVQAANADIVYVGAYPPDTIGIVQAAHEIGLKPKMFGGAMIGLLVTPIKVKLGPVMNGIVIGESFVKAPTANFPGLDDLLSRYQSDAAKRGIDPLGIAFVPFGYAAGQVLAQAVSETKSLDHDKLAAYMHSHEFSTVVGPIAFAKDGEWAESREYFTQFQSVTPNDVEQFRSGAKQPILWPPKYQTGKLIYPYADAQK